MNLPPLEEVLADVRRRLRAQSVEAARAIADLPDTDLLWLLGNGWEPPAAPAAQPSRPSDGAFVLTRQQYDDYRTVIAEAQEIKNLLTITERQFAANPDTVAQLRAALRQKAYRLQEMSRGWST